MKKSLSLLLSIGIGCVFAVVLLEVGLRIVDFDDLGVEKVGLHEVLGRIYREDISNGHGFLTSEFPDELTDDKLRTVVVGDSFPEKKRSLSPFDPEHQRAAVQDRQNVGASGTL